MKSVLRLNILLGNSSDTLNRRPGFKMVSMNCHKTPETETIYVESSA
jgi:hypothetical protein